MGRGRRYNTSAKLKILNEIKRLRVSDVPWTSVYEAVDAITDTTSESITLDALRTRFYRAQKPRKSKRKINPSKALLEHSVLDTIKAPSQPHGDTDTQNPSDKANTGLEQGIEHRSHQLGNSSGAQEQSDTHGSPVSETASCQSTASMEEYLSPTIQDLYGGQNPFEFEDDVWKANGINFNDWDYPNMEHLEQPSFFL
ncbi:hypothetical protein TWF281_002151 [Arthrobotrys megalospora]